MRNRRRSPWLMVLVLLLAGQPGLAVPGACVPGGDLGLSRTVGVAAHAGGVDVAAVPGPGAVLDGEAPAQERPAAPVTGPCGSMVMPPATDAQVAPPAAAGGVARSVLLLPEGAPGAPFFRPPRA